MSPTPLARSRDAIERRAQVLAKLSLFGVRHVVGDSLRGCGPEWRAFVEARGLHDAVSPEEERLVGALDEGRSGSWGDSASWACEPLAVCGWLLGHGDLPGFSEPATPSRWINRVLEGGAPRQPPPSTLEQTQRWRRLFWVHRRMHAFVRGVQRLDLGAWMARCGADPVELGVPLIEGDLAYDGRSLAEWSVWEMEYKLTQADLTGAHLRAMRWACGAQPAWDLVPTCPHELDGDPRCGPDHAYLGGAPPGAPELDERGGLAGHRALSWHAPVEAWPEQRLDEQDLEGRDLLEHALALGLADALPGLVKRGANIEHRDGGLQTPLLRALRRQQPEVARCLLDLGADTQVIDARGQGALHWAACGGVLAPLDRLIAEGAELDRRSESGFTALGLALTNGHPDAAASLVRAGAALESVTPDDRPALQIAANRGDAASVALLLSAGASPSAVDAHGHSALHFAASKGYAEVVALLCAGGAEVNAISNAGYTPLIAAAMGHGEATLTALIEAGADLELAEASRGGTALHFAAEGSPEAVRALLAAGAEPNPKDAQGETPLQWARRLNDDASAALLKEAPRPTRR